MHTSHKAALTRREALLRLAILPHLFLGSGNAQRSIENILRQCAAGIAACQSFDNSVV